MANHSTSPPFRFLTLRHPHSLSFLPEERRPSRCATARESSREEWSTTSSTRQSDSARLQGQNKPRARQGFISCNLCRSRKVKCPGEKPSCSMCIRKGVQCQYDTRPRRRGPDRQPGARVSKQTESPQTAESDWEHNQRQRSVSPQSDERHWLAEQRMNCKRQETQELEAAYESWAIIKRRQLEPIQLPPPLPPHSATSIAQYHFEYEPAKQEARQGLGIGRLLNGGRVNDIRLPPLIMVIGQETPRYS